MKHSNFFKGFILVTALSTGLIISSCKKEVNDFGLCDKNVGSPYNNGTVIAKAENDSNYKVGYDVATLLGYNDGKAQALKDAYHNGYVAGYNQGYGETYTSAYNSAFSSGKWDGEDDGYADGKTNGYNDGHHKGYSDGYSDGYDDGYTGNSCSAERKIPVKPNDNECYNKGYSEVVNSQKSQTDGYNAGLAANLNYQQGYQEWINDRTTYNSGRDAGYPVGRVDGYNEGRSDGYSAGYDSGYDAEYTRGYKNGWSDGYYWGYDSGYDAGYSAGQADSCVDKGHTPITAYKNSTEYKSLSIVNIQAPLHEYQASSGSINKLLAGITGKAGAMKGKIIISSEAVSVLRTKAATEAWNKKNRGDISKLIPANATYQFRKRP